MTDVSAPAAANDSAKIRSHGSGQWRTLAKFLARKIGYGVVIIFGVTVIVHVLFSLVPGGPAYAILGADATPEAVDRINEQYGLNDPSWRRYLDWVGGILQGDFGTSYRSGQPVLERIGERLPVTIELAVLATALALLASSILALVCVRRPGKLLDRAVTGATSAVISIPSFLIGLCLVYVFGVTLGVLPILGWTGLTTDPLANLKFVVLPVLMLAAHEIAEYTRVLRGDLLTTLSEDFITVARATGMPKRTVMLRYALRPSTLTLVTLSGLNFGRLLGGTVIAEAIFSLPGVGSLVVTGLTSRDLPLVQGIVVFVAIAFVVVNIVVDTLYAVIDPRVRAPMTR